MSAAAIEGARPAWEMVVGLEVHVQLRTETKAFCACSSSFGDPPNTNICPVCLALPGALPVLNDACIELAVRAALALGCTVHGTSVFARKNYFYPDLPKGYQISQYDKPLATGGALEVTLGEARHRIGVTRVHMEEDAGKSIHDRFDGATAIDLNRAGVPLIEIVSEPDLRASAEAGAYLRALKQVLEYADISDCSMELGSLRVDANVSARPRGSAELRSRTEIKNLNSFSAVEKALELEFARHCAVYEAGGTLSQQTMLWDATRGEVRPARSKEGSHDYRYFPEPDLPPLVVPAARVERERRALPEFPAAKIARYQAEFGLAAGEAGVLVASAPLARYFESVAELVTQPRAAANWVSGAVLQALNERSLDPAAAASLVPADRLAALIGLATAGTISSSAAKAVFAAMLADPEATPARIVQEQGLAQVSDDGALVTWIDEVLAEHPDEAKRFLAGERKLQGVLIGFVMKKSKGSADPKRLSQLLATRVAPP
ncbi:MAG: Asp-tRNA(Asn)/Glu-tRNA(Gln) amidotransferase subunit GatB [Gemmatimonadetes bacterium]|nr:Asp-tRNA(Asn)/Glu-tRNA(Gln) amidotransferase subunit GatB [Gemmatimonadota bacterium]